MPMADGGEGTLDAFAAAVVGARWMRERVIGPDGAAVDTEWLLLPDGTGVVELARASGLTLLDPLLPLDAHTLGFGQLIAAALRGGAARLILAAVALGSACGGAFFGSRAPRVPAPRRLLVALGGYAVLLIPLLVAPSIAVMAVFAFVSGLPIAPAFAGAYQLLDRFSVPGAVTETFAWNTTCLFVGASAGTALGGALIAAGSFRASIALSIALAFACASLVAGYARGTQLDG